MNCLKEPCLYLISLICSMRPECASKLCLKYIYYIYVIVFEDSNIFSISVLFFFCRSWHQTASYILRAREKNSKFRWHLQCRPPCNATNCFRNNIKFTSQFLLGFKVPKDDMSVVRQLFESRSKHSANSSS